MVELYQYEYGIITIILLILSTSNTEKEDKAEFMLVIYKIVFN